MIRVYIDGASAGDPGPSGAGIYYINERGETVRQAFKLTDMSNHEAEFYALLYALKVLRKDGNRAAAFYTDSQLVDDAVNDGKVKNRAYQPVLESILKASADFDLFFVNWVPSSKNREADQLARKAIHEGESPP
ncbi:ribonuclease HI [Salsuginibacillus halophilus]|uniref:Ribonuclease HI n=1 Tax=Salsuginibacillus halophilus TaxID=517424 RepID=A0A2P8HYP2_9BACI|nr:reverse transcriptase-like protein [Salsuginibacillus halophilus]PSL51358.1 ribonuclease HI [Salsuginibacillus halophilus]